jgi:glycosyltransferase involved in cell wall biosynthesis
MRRIVFITQIVGRSHPNLGATVAKIEALARRVDEVVVLCREAVEGDLPENCRVRVFESRFQFGRGLRFARALNAELDPAPLAVVVHMVPLYAVLAAPLVRPRRVPLMLWYTHWKGHVVVRFSDLVCTYVLSLDERSYPLHSRKVRAIGHGIDLREFPCQPAVPLDGRPLKVMSLGRYSPPKRLVEIVEGVRLARDRGVDACVELWGTVDSADQHVYKHELEELAARRDFVSVGGSIPRTELPAVYAQADVVASDFISPDKIVLEACSSCRPVLASHESFDTLFAGIEPPLLYERGRPETLADRVERLARLSDDERQAIGETLRERVRNMHSVETWADAILRLASR